MIFVCNVIMLFTLVAFLESIVALIDLSLTFISKHLALHEMSAKYLFIFFYFQESRRLEK